MGSKLLLDANVLLDFLLTRNDNIAPIARILRHIEDGKIKGYLTVSIIQILGYWLTKEWGNAKAKKGLLVLLNHFEILDGSKETVVAALHSTMHDIEDALQYYAALYHKLDAIVSRDKKFIKTAIPSLPVYHPDEFVQTFMAE